MRGLVSLGSLIAMSQSCWSPPDAIFATSSGALNAIFHLCDAHEYGAGLYFKYMVDEGMINPWRLHKVFDLDGLFDRLRDSPPPGLEAARVGRTRLFVSVTHAETGVTCWQEPFRCGDPWGVVKASCALPGAYMRSVRVLGEPWVDGAPATLATNALVERGYTCCMAVLTRRASDVRRAPGVVARMLARVSMRHISRDARNSFLMRYAREREERRTWMGEDEGEEVGWYSVVPMEGDPIPKRADRDKRHLVDCFLRSVQNGAGAFDVEDVGFVDLWRKSMLAVL